MATRRIVVNGDDFGRTASINTAIIQAHREGILTSTSLMVAEGAFDEAVALAKAHPTLAVGLHLVAANGRAVLPPAQIPHIVDARGRFPDSAVQAGLRYVVSATARQELAREMEAQFARFAATGLPLSHVDGHLHFHVHPIVFNLLIPLAERYGASGLRLPRDDFWLAMRYNRQGAALKATWAVIYALLCRWCLRRLQVGAQGRAPLTVTDRMYGLMQTGQMEEAYVLQVLRQLSVPTAELYFHPSTVPLEEKLGPNPGDLATLLSPAVRQAIQEGGIELANYPRLI
jgi:hopanoid biosynthesis associated protein HpnK